MRGDRADIYPVRVDIKDGSAHGGLPDRDKIKEMYPAVRIPPVARTPRLAHARTRSHHRLLWLRVEKPSK